MNNRQLLQIRSNMFQHFNIDSFTEDQMHMIANAVTQAIIDYHNIEHKDKNNDHT